jgi:hypothetical protein
MEVMQQEGADEAGPGGSEQGQQVQQVRGPWRQFLHTPYLCNADGVVLHAETRHVCRAFISPRPGDPHVYHRCARGVQPARTGQRCVVEGVTAGAGGCAY